MVARYDDEPQRFFLTGAMPKCCTPLGHGCIAEHDCTLLYPHDSRPGLCTLKRRPCLLLSFRSGRLVTSVAILLATLVIGTRLASHSETPQRKLGPNGAARRASTRFQCLRHVSSGDPISICLLCESMSPRRPCPPTCEIIM